jgi:hypothetical protein
MLHLPYLSWIHGFRRQLKIRRPSGHGGSTPPPGTNLKYSEYAVYLVVADLRSLHRLRQRNSHYDHFVTLLGLGGLLTRLEFPHCVRDIGPAGNRVTLEDATLPERESIGHPQESQRANLIESMYICATD